MSIKSLDKQKKIPKEGINDIIDYLRLFEPARRWLRRAWGLSLQDMKKFLNNKEKKS
jgi:hypothetical protein